MKYENSKILVFHNYNTGFSKTCNLLFGKAYLRGDLMRKYKTKFVSLESFARNTQFIEKGSQI